jgi:hypothetical protein
MADIDVSAVGLASPPVQPYQEEYTPGILVRNNGLNPVTATGYIQMWDKVSGVLLGSWPVQSGELTPGTTGTAYAADALDFAEYEPGKTLLMGGHVTCPGDQVSTNNQLQPVTLTVQEGEHPGPPVVEAHAAQHEAGGSDQIDISGLQGELYSPQPPKTHAGSHQQGGADELNVDGLAGQLGEAQTPADHCISHQDGGHDELDLTGLHGLTGTPQTPTTHNPSHETGGSDEINVVGLHGQLGDPQVPVTHGNERHLTPFIDADDLADHNTSDSAHAESDNLEHVANKGQPSGYCPLNSGSVVPIDHLGSGGGGGTLFLRDDSSWQPGFTNLGTTPQHAARWMPLQGSGNTGIRNDSYPNFPGAVEHFCVPAAVYTSGSHTILSLAIPASKPSHFCIRNHWSARWATGNSGSYNFLVEFGNLTHGWTTLHHLDRSVSGSMQNTPHILETQLTFTVSGSWLYLAATALLHSARSYGSLGCQMDCLGSIYANDTVHWDATVANYVRITLSVSSLGSLVRGPGFSQLIFTT